MASSRLTSGQFSNVNPPVHAWAAWRVYKMEWRRRGIADRGFLEKVFHKLLLNFTWWVNRKDPDGMNVFEGGFLGLDNIGLFDRSKPLPTGGHIEQSDGTSWMGMYCLNMLAIAMELARDDPAYEDVASKFFEHFVYITQAMNNRGGHGISLWDEEDGFYYDVLHLPDEQHHFLKVRSMVGLIPLYAVEVLEPEALDALPGFKRRMQWFLENVPNVPHHIEMTQTSAHGVRRQLSIVSRRKLLRILHYMLDEQEFLAPTGSAACRSSTPATLTYWRLTIGSIGWVMTLRSLRRVCSAAIPIGAALCGFPSIFSSSNPCRGSITITATA